MNITWTRPRSLRVELPEGTDIVALRRRINSITHVAGSAATQAVLTFGLAHNISSYAVRKTYSEIRHALVSFGVITPNDRAKRTYTGSVR